MRHLVLACSLACWFAAAGVLTGCGSSRANLTLTGEAPLNVNEAGESTPVKVRIYQLRNDARFRAATVESLWTGDKAALGGDLLGQRVEVMVKPMGKEERPVEVGFDLDPETTFIGVLGLYSRSDAKDNRTVIIPVDQADDVRLLLTRYAVSIAPRPAAQATP